MDDDTTRRLGRLEENQLKMVDTLARIEAHLADMNGDLGDVVAEVGSVPDRDARGSRETLGFRLHLLENDSAAANAAKAALAAASEAKRTAWSWKQKNVLFAFAAIAAFAALHDPIAALLRLFGIGG